MKIASLLIPVVGAAIVATASTAGQAQVFSSNGRSGVYVQGGGQGFAGTFDADGFHGIMVGPNGRVKRLQGAANPFHPFRGQQQAAQGSGAYAGAMAGNGVAVGPGGFDPFSFVFGGSPNSAAASMFAGPERSQEMNVAKRHFRDGQYEKSLLSANHAVQVEPANTDALQMQTLALFALQRYENAAAGAYEVLSLDTRWDWADLRAMYRDTPTYLAHLRQLEDDAGQPAAAAGTHFLLAYHYLVLDKSEKARTALQQTLRVQPENQLARELLDRLPPQLD